MAPAAIASLPSILSVDEALADLLAAYEVAGRAPATIEAFRLHVTRLSDFVYGEHGISALDQVTTRHACRTSASET